MEQEGDIPVQDVPCRPTIGKPRIPAPIVCRAPAHSKRSQEVIQRQISSADVIHQLAQCARSHKPDRCRVSRVSTPNRAIQSTLPAASSDRWYGARPISTKMTRCAKNWPNNSIRPRCAAPRCMISMKTRNNLIRTRCASASGSGYAIMSPRRKGRWHSS